MMSTPDASDMLIPSALPFNVAGISQSIAGPNLGKPPRSAIRPTTLTMTVCVREVPSVHGLSTVFIVESGANMSYLHSTALIARIPPGWGR